MFISAPGVKIPFPEKIDEGFQVFPESLYINVSYEKLSALISEFYKLLPEPFFLAIHIPLSIYEERELGGEMFHDEVLYLDGQTQNQIDEIMELYGEVLFADGISKFAIASHTAHEEIFIQKYKLTQIYSKTPKKYIPLLEKYGITRTPHLITVWDTFTEEFPGECSKMIVNGISIYDVVEKLKGRGMYRAKLEEKAPM